MVREHEPKQPSEAHLTAGKAVDTRRFMEQIGSAEAVMLRSSRSSERIRLICADAQVNPRRARRLVRAVNMLWHYRAQAFGSASKARVQLLPRVQEVFERALMAGQYGHALGALKLQAELCGLSRDVVAGLDVPQEAPDDLDEKVRRTSDAVMNRLLAFGSNGHAGNGKANGANGSNGNGRGQA